MVGCRIPNIQCVDIKVSTASTNHEHKTQPCMSTRLSRGHSMLSHSLRQTGVTSVSFRRFSLHLLKTVVVGGPATNKYLLAAFLLDAVVFLSHFPSLNNHCDYSAVYFMLMAKKGSTYRTVQMLTCCDSNTTVMKVLATVLPPGKQRKTPCLLVSSSLCRMSRHHRGQYNSH